MRDKYYILKGHEAVPTDDDILAWAKWFEKSDRHVANETIGNARISTVFLGLDHNFGPQGPPLIFETMVFGGALDQEQERYSTWEEAETGHKAMAQRVKEAEHS